MGREIIKYLIHNQFIFAMFIIAVGWFMFLVKDILVLMFIAYILMATLSSYVDVLRSRNIPKGIAVFICYSITIIFLVLLIRPIILFFTTQIQVLVQSFPVYLKDAANLIGIHLSSTQLNSFLGTQVDTIGKNAFTVTGKIFGGLFSTIIVFVLSFYLLMDHEKLKEGISSLFPRQYKDDIIQTLRQIDYKLGAWFRGQIVLSFAIGFITWIVLTILGLEFALPLAILAGMLEVVPTIGPIISAVPAAVVALAISPTMMVIVILAYIVIQVLENNLLVPKIMQRAVGLNPIIVIIGITIGAQLMGVLGALLSIPFISMLIILYHHLKNFE